MQEKKGESNRCWRGGGGMEGFEMSASLGRFVGALIRSSGKHDHLDSRTFGVKRNKIHALNCAKRILVLGEANPKILSSFILVQISRATK